MDRDVLIIPESIAHHKVEPIIIPARSNCVLRIEADEVISADLVAIKKHELNENGRPRLYTAYSAAFSNGLAICKAYPSSVFRRVYLYNI